MGGLSTVIGRSGSAKTTRTLCLIRSPQVFTPPETSQRLWAEPEPNPSASLGLPAESVRHAVLPATGHGQVWASLRMVKCVTEPESGAWAQPATPPPATNLEKRFKLLHCHFLSTWGGGKRNFLINGHLFILTSLNFSHLPSNLHWIQYTKTFFPIAQDSF